MDEVLALSDVGVRRGSSWILSGVSWTVRPGEQWVVLGPNGAGKSTLMAIAAGRTFPTVGVVDILGERLGRTDTSELRTRIGVVGAGTPAIPPRERVRDAVVTAAYGINGRWRESYDDADLARADALLSRLGVAHLAERRYGTLSDGERKRTQIARALMADPELCLWDEPAAGLDLGAREELLARLTRMAADPHAPATVLVTHHVEEIPQGTTHALILREGTVVGMGPLEDALDDVTLSRAYGTPIRVFRVGERWTAQASHA
ncbi:MAG: ABC transporter ATP-binding protein [bacterium]